MDSLHKCGGAIELTGQGDTKRWECSRCSAFTFDIRADRLPSGTDLHANMAAMAKGSKRSSDRLTEAAPTNLKFVLVNHKDIERVRSYLPSNYFVFFTHKDHVVVAGEDNHGWTATEYVIPRLRSGLMAARLITPKDYATEYMSGDPATDDLPWPAKQVIEGLSRDSK